MTTFPQNNLRPSMKQGIGRIIRFFVFVTIFVLIIINWQTVKDIFNYKAVYSDIASSVKTGIAFDNTKTLKIPEIRLSEKTEIKYEAPKTTKPDSIEIIKIGIEAPLVFIESTNDKDYDKALKNGVVHYYESALPGENGQALFLGHSAPSGWPKINYDWVFSKVNDLVEGDEIIINYNGGEYRYSVTQKFILKQGDDVPNEDLTNSKSMVVLISCWPPGVNYKRIAIEAELIKN